MWRKSHFRWPKDGWPKYERRYNADWKSKPVCSEADFMGRKFSFSKSFVWLFPLANLSDSVDNLHFLCFPSLIERNFDNVYVISQPGYVWTAQWPTSLLALDWKLVNKMAIFHSIEGPRLRCYTKFEYSSFFQAHDFPLRSKQYSALPLTWTAYK